MSTLSGVFPNAITPTFGPSQDPAAQSRQRKDNEQVVFSPVEEVESNTAIRHTGIEQPGRLEAEQAVNTASKTNRAQPQDDSVEEVHARDRQDQVAQDKVKAQSDRRAEQDEVRLQKDIELIQELTARDREVKNHEQAHQSVGGQYAGAMEFTYKQGPDGKRYAVGGEVSIDVGKVSGDPQATLQKAEQVRRAALAPAEPSTQDRQVAALASQMSIEAQNDIRQIERQEVEKSSEERAEQRALAEDDETKTEDSSKSETEKAEQAANDSEKRLESIFEKTSNAVESALDAAYHTTTQQEVGFNLDTTV